MSIHEPRDRSDFRRYLEEVKQALEALPPQLGPLLDTLYAAYQAERTVFLIGNGGSAATASHFGQDLSKGTVPEGVPGKRLRAVSLADNISLITALANDGGYDRIFVEQLITLGRPGDVLLAISSSGNSPNVLAAVEYANGKGIETIGLTGFDAGGLGRMARVNVNVPAGEVGVVEAVHVMVLHFCVLNLRERIARDQGVA